MKEILQKRSEGSLQQRSDGNLAEKDWNNWGNLAEKEWRKSCRKGVNESLQARSEGKLAGKEWGRSLQKRSEGEPEGKEWRRARRKRVKMCLKDRSEGELEGNEWTRLDEINKATKWKTDRINTVGSRRPKKLLQILFQKICCEKLCKHAKPQLNFRKMQLKISRNFAVPL